MVRDLRMPGRAEQDGIVLPDQVPAIRGHHATVPFVVLAAPVEVVNREPEAPLARRDGVEHLDAGRDHLGADAVARDGRDRVGLHDGSPKVVAAGFAAQSRSWTACSRSLQTFWRFFEEDRSPRGGLRTAKKFHARWRTGASWTVG